MRNLMAAWGGQLLSVVVTFVVRAVFVRELSMDYLGVESLFSSILTILSLAELGVGSAITFSLYRPIAENDTERLKSTMRFFKRVYCSIGVLIAVIGFCLFPFVQVFIENPPDLPYLNFYFLFFVMNTAVSYFFSYKGLLLYAYQRDYVVSLVRYSVQIVLSIAQIVMLVLTKNYFVFLSIMLLTTVVQNVLISRAADRAYPYLNEKDAGKIDKGDLKSISQNTVALLLHRIAGTASIPASSLIVSKFIGIGTIAVYGNYILVLGSVQRILSRLFDAVTASVGNLGVLEGKGRQREIFDQCLFVSGFVPGVAFCVALCCLKPFVGLWLGEEYVFPLETTILLVFWYYLQGIRAAGQTFTSAYGLYWKSWYKAVAETVVLLGLSLVLVQTLGVNGVALSGILSMAFVSIPIETYVVAKYSLDTKARRYLAVIARHVAFTIVYTGIALAVCEAIPLQGVLAVVVNFAVSLIISMSLGVLLYATTKERHNLKNLYQRVLRLVKR